MKQNDCCGCQLCKSENHDPNCLARLRPENQKQRRVALLAAWYIEATRLPIKPSKQMERDLDELEKLDNSDDIFRMAKEVIKLLEVQ